MVTKNSNEQNTNVKILLLFCKIFVSYLKSTMIIFNSIFFNKRLKVLVKIIINVSNIANFDKTKFIDHNFEPFSILHNVSFIKFYIKRSHING